VAGCARRDSARSHTTSLGRHDTRCAECRFVLLGATRASACASRCSRRDDSRAPTLEVPVLVDSTWYTAKDLDLYPQALAPVDPPYPASVSNVTGEVTVLLAIDEFGVCRTRQW